MPKIAIIYHSGYGHTKFVAENITQGAASVPGVEVTLLTTDEAIARLAELDSYDTLVFGCPTYMGGPSAQFKTFADATSKPWFSQKWKDKLAAGFTNSGGLSGDKFSTLSYLWTLSQQHSMIWLSQGLMAEGPTPDHLNRIGAWGGVMTQSPQGEASPPPKDLETARLFGVRIATLTTRWTATK